MHQIQISPHLGKFLETARRINDVYGAGVAKESTVRFWFQRFLENEELKAIVEADPSQSTSKISVGFGVSDKTVLINLKQIGKLNLPTRVDFCVTFFNRHNNEGILNRIITCDEKWILAGVVHYSFLKSGKRLRQTWGHGTL
ncbi:hypothetical protein ABMA28_015124 [Loxostege sticticalis]|uniref:Mos1 transposase HTH domain-containing protein n=1 Tax=Loxostege sticticalis TaxID=481309 RepID=A0ABD0TEG4_LOXSC